MSKINISGIVRDITTRTSYLTPIVEAVCNSIDAIEDQSKGKIDIIVKREKPLPGTDEKGLGNIISLDIKDNGVGFNSDNRDSFDTFKSGYKYEQGGKGFGRFMYIKYFSDVKIESIYKMDDSLKLRKFRFGTKNDIIVDEIEEEISKGETGTILHLSNLKKKSAISDKGLDVIARKLLEKLLVFFVDESKPIPIIRIMEENGSDPIILNDLIGKGKEIQLIESKSLDLISKQTGEILDFTLQIYKIFYSQSISRISLTANKREVTETALHKYIPEFKETLFEIDEKGNSHNYIVKGYVIGKFLDSNVNTERDGFVLGKEQNEIFSDISEPEIEKKASEVIWNTFEEELSKRLEEKIAKVNLYVNTNAPWHRPLIKEIDMKSLPIGISDSELEMKFQKAKFDKEQSIRIQLFELKNNGDKIDDETYDKEIKNLANEISDSSKNDLIHYIFNRKKIIDLFDELRSRKEDGTSYLEESLHNLIYPMGKNSEETEYEKHNLWLIDERLVFSQFTASDQSNFKGDKEAPDIAIFFDKTDFFRQGENIITSPVCIVEFKRPKRVNYSDSENPITQALRYSRKILEGKYEMPNGLEPIKVSKYHTPVYIYIICDIVNRIQQFADEYSLTTAPDGERYFGYNKAHNAYIELMSYRGLIDNAKMRNAIFFHKLGIDI